MKAYIPIPGICENFLPCRRDIEMVKDLTLGITLDEPGQSRVLTGIFMLRKRGGAENI